MTSDAARERVAFLPIGCPIHPRPIKPTDKKKGAGNASPLAAAARRPAPRPERPGHDRGGELDREMRLGMEDWCDLLDGLLNTGGMLPSRDLASRVVGFFEDEYWRAEDARIQGRSPFLVAAGVAVVLLSPGCRRGVRNGAPVTQTRPTRGNPVGAVIGPASTGNRSRADG